MHCASRASSCRDKWFPLLFSICFESCLACFCAFMNSSEHHRAWTALSVWSTVWGSLNMWTNCRLVVYLLHIVRVRFRSRKSRICGNRVVLNYVYSCLSCVLTFFIINGRERMGSLWIYYSWYICYAFMLVCLWFRKVFVRNCFTFSKVILYVLD
jgi:hypothetical protein